MKHYLKLILMVTFLCKTSFTAKFDVLTYNVQMRPILDDNAYKAPRISSKLNAYDVVVLQESFSNKEALMASDLHPFAKHFTDKRNCFCFVDSGLSTLSFFPITKSKTVHYNAYWGLQDAIASKGILMTRHLVEGLVLDIYTTHMQATSGTLGYKSRLQQVDQLIDFVNQNSPEENSILIVGDFNMSPLRPGREFKDFRPNHYGSEEDMLQRTTAFQKLMDKLDLTDVQDMLTTEKVDDIERMLFRSGYGHDFKPILVRKDSARFVDEKNAPLSDSTPLVVSFSLESKPSGETQQD